MSKNKKNLLLIFLFSLAALVVALTPSFLNAVSGIMETQRISGYENAVAKMNEEEAKRLYKQATAYNKKIAKIQQEEVFHYQGEKATDSAYQKVLNTNGDGVMGYIEVPKQNIYLPIGHGTADALLRTSAGHMYGTSLPVNGSSVNAVLSGHSGLASAKLFTGLLNVKNGDTFKIHVLGRVNTYQVRDIEKVLPDDETPFLQVVPDEDLVTLYTCTPPGINDHRLLIRGTYTGTEPEGASATSTLHRQNLGSILKAILLAAIPTAYAIFWIRKLRKTGGIQS